MSNTRYIPCREYDPPGLWCFNCLQGDTKNCQDPRVIGKKPKVTGSSA